MYSQSHFQFIPYLLSLVVLQILQIYMKNILGARMKVPNNINQMIMVWHNHYLSWQGHNYIMYIIIILFIWTWTLRELWTINIILRKFDIHIQRGCQLEIWWEQVYLVTTVYREMFALVLFSPHVPSLSAGKFRTRQIPMSHIIMIISL